MAYDGEMHPKGNTPKPGPHDSRGGSNEDYHIRPEKGQVASSEFSDAQDFGSGLKHDSDALDRHPKTHRSGGQS